MIRKVSLPLKIKIISLISILLIAAISFFLIFALDLFHKDKSAYIYETTLMGSESLASQTRDYLRNATSILNSLANKPSQQVIESSNTMVEFSRYEKGKRSQTLYNQKLLETYAQTKANLQDVARHFPLPKKQLKQTITNSTLPGGIPLLLIAIRHDDQVYAGRFLHIELIDSIKKNDLYHSGIIDKNSNILASSTTKIDQNHMAISSAIRSSQIRSGSVEIILESKPMLLSFSELPHLNLYAITLVERDTAFQAARFLIKKSLFISIIVLAIAAIFGILFSRSLTAHLEKLFKATQKMAQGDFTTKVSIKAKDEIGVLADSFNYMSSEITRYMEEMKEKARVENELKVAKLVQDSFFPSKDQTHDFFDISSFYTPATECGGDWWGVIEDGNKLILFVADATGHGVPAAFLTATANCCASNLKYLARKEPDILSSPDKILELMNHAVCNVAEDILMTCFVAIIDPNLGTISYANASHNPPLLFKHSANEPQKSDLQPLLKSKGPRLGHKPDSQFEAYTDNIAPNDQLILFTDGLLESTDRELKQWGQRNFIKSLLKSIKEGPKSAVTCVIDDLDKFRGDMPFDDDITFVVARMKHGSTHKNIPPPI